MNRATAPAETVAFVLQRRITTHAYLEVNEGRIHPQSPRGGLWIDFATPDGFVRVVLPVSTDEEVEVYGYVGQPSAIGGGTVHVDSWSARFDAGTPADLVVTFIETAMVER